MATEKQIQSNEQSANRDIEQSDDAEKIKRAFSNAENLIQVRKLAEGYSNLCAHQGKLTTSQKKKEVDLRTDLSMLYGLENGLWTANLSHRKYYSALAKMRQCIVKEYNCRTPVEFMLADRIVASYWRAMKYDTYFNRLIEKEDGGYSFDQLKVNVVKEFNKGMELANRQLHANVILLKELKQPKLDVRVRADNAYFAQNQQVINTEEKPTPDTNPETIKTK